MHGILFKLTNKVAQVNFTDNTILTMNAHTKMIIFIDSFGLSSVSHCSNALRSSNEQFVGKVR